MNKRVFPIEVNTINRINCCISESENTENIINSGQELIEKLVPILMLCSKHDNKKFINFLNSKDNYFIPNHPFKNIGEPVSSCLPNTILINSGSHKIILKIYELIDFGLSYGERLSKSVEEYGNSDDIHFPVYHTKEEFYDLSVDMNSTSIDDKSFISEYTNMPLILAMIIKESFDENILHEFSKILSNEDELEEIIENYCASFILSTEK